MSVFLLWLILVVVPNVAVLFAVLLTALCIGGALGGLFILVEQVHEDECWPTVKKWLVVYGFVTCLVTVGTVMTPTKSQMVYLVGGYFVTNVDGIKKMPPNIVKSANKFLEEHAGDE